MKMYSEGQFSLKVIFAKNFQYISIECGWHSTHLQHQQSGHWGKRIVTSGQYGLHGFSKNKDKYPCTLALFHSHGTTLHSLGLLISNPLSFDLSFHKGKNCIRVWRIKKLTLGESNGTEQLGNQGVIMLLEKNNY